MVAHKKSDDEYLKQRYIYVLDEVWECLDKVAFDMRIDRAKLVRDLLTAWCAHFPDWEDAIFTRRGVDELKRVEMPKEPYAGYLKTLGFGEATHRG